MHLEDADRRFAGSRSPGLFSRSYDLRPPLQCARVAELQQLAITELRRFANSRSEDGAVLCGLEGMPAAGKSSLCRRLSPELVSDYAGIDVGPTGYPPLEPDPHGRISLASIQRNMSFFMHKEIERTTALRRRKARYCLLDRTWVSQLVFLYSVAWAVRLSEEPVLLCLEDLRMLAASGRLYVPDWLVILRVPTRRSVQATTKRDGGFFNQDLRRLLNAAERVRFHAARGSIYRALARLREPRIVSQSYQSDPVAKLRSVLLPPVPSRGDDEELFSALQRVLLSDHRPTEEEVCSNRW